MKISKISSLQNPLLKHIVHVRQNRDYRDMHHTVIISGLKQIQEIANLTKFKTLFVYDESLIPKGITAEDVFVVSENVMKKASGLQSPDGYLAEVLMPRYSSLKELKRLVVLDQVSDPGNLGTILRSALALNWEAVFVLDQTVDPFNDKALNAAKGAAFKFPVLRGSWDDLRALLKKHELQLIVADIKGNSIDQVKKIDKKALVFSNEANGPSEEALKQCELVTIPINVKMESLNVAVAAGILMYALE